MSKKYTMLFITVFCIGLLCAGGTYAYWTWTSNVNKNVVFNTSKEISQYVVYDEGDSYFIGDFKPASNYCGGISNTISFYKTTGDAELVDLEATIYMDVNAIENDIAASDDVYWVLTSGNASSCTGDLSDAVNYGTFKGKADGSVITMLQNIAVTTSQQQFTTWIWIDSSGSNLSSLSGETIDTNIWTQIDMLDKESSSIGSSSGQSGPDLDTGLIPVTLSADGIATTVSETDSSWYNYSNKQWANAVLVNQYATSGVTGSKSREYYKNNPGTTVIESDILAYYVWIPRYKYKIWTIDATKTTSPQTIDIVFENKIDPVTTGSQVGDYMTHPAFIWDGSPIAGFWVGKFETTGDATTPTIKPNVVALTKQNVSTQFITSLKFSGGTFDSSTGAVSFSGDATYGLSSNMDSHMMKNTEWGAVAYLSHSQYGINQEIYINNSSGHYTGRSGGNVGGSVNSLATQFGSDSTSTKYNSYGYYTWIGQIIDSSGNINGYAADRTLGTKAATTGNVTGVYDMSGGSYEYVMGKYGNIDEDSYFTTFPSNKYYDLYSASQFTGEYTTNINLCTLETCGGHALYETAGWYSDSKNFVYSDLPWFYRGGSIFNGVYAGAFYSDGSGANRSSHSSFRSVVIKGTE